MLLTRSLPPQFLLPAWSTRHLAQASQRAQVSTSTFVDHRNFRRLVLSEDKAAVRKPITQDDHIEREKAKSGYQEAQSQKPMSLFDELFPEESHGRRKREHAAEKRLEKLPAFNWNSKVNVRDRADKERRNREEQYKSIPLRDRPAREDATTAYRPTPLNPSEMERMRNDLDRQPRVTTLPSVLVLNACSKTLEESDFFRLGPRGDHIEGWTSGIIKVIPARDNNTLEKLGYYFILCSNDAAARAYLDRTMRLHRLAKSSMALEVSGVPIPPGYLQDGEDPAKVLQSFSLVPAYGKLSLRLLNRPYRPSVVRLLKDGGPAARIIRESKAGEIVIFFVDIGHITKYELLEALGNDGKRRNLHWKFGRERGQHVVRLDSDYQDDNLAEPDQGLEQSPDSESYRARKKVGWRRPARYVISLRDRNEARRFVREWHRRPFPVRQERNPGDEPTPIVNAEILW